MASETGGLWSRRAAKPYRKYRPLPALLIIAALCAVAAFVWTNAITSASDIEKDIRCRPQADPPPGTTYTELAPDALDDLPPTPPDRIALRVLNANGTRGQAALTTATLEQLGFTRTAPPRNDEAFPEKKAECHGQIRFGENGTGAARTVHLVDPCLQLIRDNRQDTSVDLSIGTMFNQAQPPSANRKILDKLNAWSAENIGKGHNEQANTTQSLDIDEQLLEQTAPNYC